MKIGFFILVLISFFIFTGAISLYFYLPATNKTRAVVNKILIIPVISEVNTVETQSLKSVVDKVLEGTSGAYGVALNNLTTGEFYYSNEHKVFESASLYKLWIMATAFQQIQNGQLQKDQVLSGDIALLNKSFNIDPEYVESTSGTIQLTVGEALTQMITISHNYSALLLTNAVSISAVQDFLKENGLTESEIGEEDGSPKTTAYDVSLFLQKLYKGEFASPQYTNEMIALLKNQQLGEGIPKYIPDKSRVANKTGELDFFKHDAGIIYMGNGDYIIVVMSESEFPKIAQENIALISKGVFEYFADN